VWQLVLKEFAILSLFFSPALSDSSWKHITSRVKESEAKRRRRKENQYQHSLSEPNTGVHKHKFRYNFKQSYEDLLDVDSTDDRGSVNQFVKPRTSHWKVSFNKMMYILLCLQCHYYTVFKFVSKKFPYYTKNVLKL
jgi:hypothetical protein